MLHVWGPFALWTAVGLRSERATQTMGSHEAWRNFLRRILGKWSVNYRISHVEILKKGTRQAMTSNELAFDGVGLKPVDIAKQRTQRTTVFLRNVEYVVHFETGLDAYRAGPEDNIGKILSMAESRFGKGKQDRAPYLGVRECGAKWERVEDRSALPQPERFDEDLGIAFYGTDWRNELNYFCPLEIKGGVMRYPTWDEVREFGMTKPLKRAS